MQGNVQEWCQDQALLFKTDTGEMSDKEQLGKLSNSSNRVLRGGSFFNYAANVRSASRSTDQPDIRYLVSGFRVSRTLPLVPLTALPPA